MCAKHCKAGERNNPSVRFQNTIYHSIGICLGRSYHLKFLPEKILYLHMQHSLNILYICQELFKNQFQTLFEKAFIRRHPKTLSDVICTLENCPEDFVSNFSLTHVASSSSSQLFYEIVKCQNNIKRYLLTQKDVDV